MKGTKETFILAAAARCFEILALAAYSSAELALLEDEEGER